MAMQTCFFFNDTATTEIYTTPLIDVMLVLLIMLIVTLPPQNHAVKLDTPAPCSDCAELVDLPPIRVAVDFDGSLLWNGAPVSITDLGHRLRVEAHRARQAEVHIEPHRRARYGEVAHVMAVAHREGITRLGVVGGG